MTICQMLASINWLEVAQTIAALFTAYVAFAALNTWKHQSKAQKQSDYLDTLTDTVHEYIQALASPIEILKIINIAIESHKGIPSSPDYGSNTHVVAYIARHGNDDSKRLWQHLSKSESMSTRISSLIARGQVYGFKNFDECINSTKMLLWQNQRLQVVASVIGSTSLNWNHKVVIKTIENMLTVTPGDIEDHVRRYNIDYLKFVDDNYRQIYSTT